MIVGIDGSNLRRGGGVTHLIELLRAANPELDGFSQVIVWSSRATLMQIEERPWLIKSHEDVLDGGLPARALWQRFRLPLLARSAHCDVLFVPGGSYAGRFQPVVTMSRNLLPFEWRELRRFGCSRSGLKLLALRAIQRRSFRRAAGLIFLTGYARDVVMSVVRRTRHSTIIPHGVDARFCRAPRTQPPIERFSESRPCRLVYVSIIDFYKHQPRVAEAVARLREAGLPVVLDLIGPAHLPALKQLCATLSRLDGADKFIRYQGAIAHTSLPEHYAEADLFVFASSCENMPNILLEGMASGLPIACSNRGPMPEVLGNAGLYFDPEDAADIARVLRRLIESPSLRAELAQAAFERVKFYTWARCARETFAFLAMVARAKRQ